MHSLLNVLLLLSLLAGPSTSLAQNEETTSTQDEEETEQPRTKKGIRDFKAALLCVGPDPEFRFTMLANGRQKELPPRPGEAPPDELGTKVGEDFVTFRNALGRLSQRFDITVPEDGGGFFALVDADKKTWLRAEIPPELKQAGTALVWPKFPELNWNNRSFRWLDDSEQAFPFGQIRVINLLPSTVQIFIDKQRIEPLKRGGMTLLPPPTSQKDQEVAIFVKGADDKPYHLHTRMNSTSSDLRYTLVVYPTKQIRKGVPAQVRVIRELKR